MPIHDQCTPATGVALARAERRRSFLARDSRSANQPTAAVNASAIRNDSAAVEESSGREAASGQASASSVHSMDTNMCGAASGRDQDDRLAHQDFVKNARTAVRILDAYPSPA